MISVAATVSKMTSEVNTPLFEERKTTECRCGNKAKFIKDYFVSESKQLRENGDGDTTKRNVENACGVMRRRYCENCLSRVALLQKKINARLNLKIFFSVFIPLFLFAALSAVSYYVFKDASSLVTFSAFSVLTVVCSVVLLTAFNITQSKRKRIGAGDYSDLKAIDALLDSLNFGFDDFKKIKELPSTDVLVDGDGRVNYGMERSGYNMRVLYSGKITLEPMVKRINYPFVGDAEYIRKSYTHAELLKDNIKTASEKNASEKDFDIRYGVLYRYSGLTVNVTVPDGVTKIAAQAFKRSKNCETITLPDSVEEIEKEAFAFCPAQSIRIPSGIKRISSFCFYSSAITEVELPPEVEEIEDNAFGECSRLEKANINLGCKKIGEAAFKNCTSLSDVVLNGGTEILSDYCFNGCKNLEVIDIPDGCRELGNFAFEGCTGLKEVYIPETVQFVGGRVFEGATSMSIVGKRGSYAEKFADEYRLRFTVQGEHRYKKQHKAKRF